jgi:hypothetical protein
MKNKYNTIDLKNYLPASILLFTYFILTAFINAPANNRNFSEAIMMKVQQESDAITVSVKTSKDNKVQFYMFNTEGNLVKELNISGSKKVSITLLEKGVYLYEFFNNDERLKTGKIELK